MKILILHQINIDQPNQAADRLVNAVAARDLYNLPAIILILVLPQLLIWSAGAIL